MQKNLTEGSVTKTILLFSLPMIAGNLLQQLYNIADTLIVGRFLGSGALAAVGASYTLMTFLTSIFLGLCMGSGAVFSIRYGEKDQKQLEKSIGASFLLIGITAVIVNLAVFLFIDPIMGLLQVPQEIYGMMRDYLWVIFLGILATFLYNFFASVLRAVGNSVVPLVFLAACAILNIVLDLVLIIIFHMGAAGAAYATVISQGVSGVGCLLYIWKKVPLLKLEKADFRPEGYLAKMQLSVGLPMALQYSITAIGAMMVQSSLNLLGSLSVAAYTAANKIEQIGTQAYVALGTTMATYCAQNMGAGQIKRIRQGFRSATIMGSIYGVILAIPMMTVGKYLVHFFVSENAGQIMNQADIYLKWTFLFMIPLTIVNVYRNGIQGMGYGVLPMMAGVAELVGRGAVAMVAGWKRSFVGACLASPAAWILAGGLLILMYFKVVKEQEKVFGESVQVKNEKI